jgi:hypothetical protein
MKRSLVIISLLAVAALSACATRALLPGTQAPAATEAPAMPELGVQSLTNKAANNFGYGGAGAADSSRGAAEAPAAQPAPAQAQERLVVENADLSIVVADVNGRVKQIENMAKAMGGFLVSENVYQTAVNDGEPVPQAAITVRVPHEKLDDALTQIKNGAVDVQNETRSGTDVTDQYVDLQSRLKAKQAAEAQLLTIMQGATKTQDVLDVYAQLQQIQSDIEVLQGQIKYYEQSAALSAISVTVVAEETVKPIKVAGWVPAGVARDALQSLIFFWQDFVDFLIRFFLYVLPVLLTIAVPLYVLFLLIRWILRRTRKPRVVVPVETPK